MAISHLKEKLWKQETSFDILARIVITIRNSHVITDIINVVVNKTETAT